MLEMRTKHRLLAAWAGWDPLHHELSLRSLMSFRRRRSQAVGRLAAGWHCIRHVCVQAARLLHAIGVAGLRGTPLFSAPRPVTLPDVQLRLHLADEAHRCTRSAKAAFLPPSPEILAADQVFYAGFGWRGVLSGNANPQECPGEQMFSNWLSPGTLFSIGRSKLTQIRTEVSATNFSS